MSLRSGGPVVMLLENFTYPEDTRVRNEAEALAGAGYQITVLAPRGRGQSSRESLNGVSVHRYRIVWAGRSASSYALEYGVAHAQLLTRALAALAGGARILHFHGPPDTLALAGLLARRVHATVVYDMHDSGPELFAAKFGNSPAVRALRCAQRAAITCADHVIVTNETQRALVVAAPTRHPVEVTVIRNGPRLTEFPEPPPARRGLLRDPRLVYVGTLDVQDGVLELAELLAAPALRGAHLTVAGDGSLREELAARFRAAGVERSVTFTGRVPHQQVAALIAAADIAVDPAPATALNHGSTMIKIAEYMAAGRPTVAYDLRETRVTAGDSALYARCGEPADLAELIAQLALDGRRRIRLGELARQRALELSWERSREALLALYGRLGPREH